MDDNKLARIARYAWPSAAGRGAATCPRRSGVGGPLWVAALLIVLALAGCSGQPAAPAEVARAEPAGVNVAAAAPTAPATATPLPPPTASPTMTMTPSPTATPTPSPTMTATATPVPQPIRLTAGGCCTQPFWSPDGAEVRFIDRPPDDPRVGIWGVALAEPEKRSLRD